jgi:hypothetical protein
MGPRSTQNRPRHDQPYIDRWPLWNEPFSKVTAPLDVAGRAPATSAAFQQSQTTTRSQPCRGRNQGDAGVAIGLRIRPVWHDHRDRAAPHRRSPTSPWSAPCMNRRKAMTFGRGNLTKTRDSAACSNSDFIQSVETWGTSETARRLGISLRAVQQRRRHIEEVEGPLIVSPLQPTPACSDSHFEQLLETLGVAGAARHLGISRRNVQRRRRRLVAKADRGWHDLDFDRVHSLGRSQLVQIWCRTHQRLEERWVALDRIPKRKLRRLVKPLLALRCA